MAVTKEIETLIPAFEVHIDGSRMPPEAQLEIFEIEVDMETEAVGMFSFLINAGERERERFTLIDSNTLQPGNEIRIKIGYGAPLKTMIVGEITSLAPDYPESGAVVLRVQGFERLYRLGFGRKTRSFRNMKDSDIAAQIAQDWKLTPEIESTDITHEYILQNNQTDREFLLERARLNRYEAGVEDKTLYFQKPKEDTGHISTLTYGDTLIDFYPRLTTINQASKVVVRDWNPQERSEIVGEAGVGDETSKMGRSQTGGDVVRRISGESLLSIYREKAGTKEEAEALAQNYLNKIAMEFITGEGSCIGNPEIKTGQVIELAELGTRFSGLYYVTSCKHVVNDRGYTTYFNVKRNAI